MKPIGLEAEEDFHLACLLSLFFACIDDSPLDSSFQALL